VVVNDHPCRIGLTIGVALSPTDSTESAELLRRADAAMYAGKRAGRHCLQRSVDLAPA
jgi:GGDEF domain-containing protein